MRLVTFSADGGAPQAGAVSGDKITAVDGHTVSTVNQFVATIANYSPGNTVTFTVQSSSGTSNVKVTLGTQPAVAATSSGNNGGNGGNGGLIP